MCSCPFEFDSAGRSRISVGSTESDRSHVVDGVDLLQVESFWLSEAFHNGGVNVQAYGGAS